MSRTPRAVGISGPIGSGKSSLAQVLAITCPVSGYVHPFAKPVKEIARQMGWNGKKDKKGRRLLQLVGTECGRECVHPDVWVRLWRKDMVVDIQDSVAIADDLRFPNELKAAHRLRGMPVGRGKAVRSILLLPLYSVPAVAHPSENGLPAAAFDVVVEIPRKFSKRQWEVVTGRIAAAILENGRGEYEVDRRGRVLKKGQVVA